MLNALLLLISTDDMKYLMDQKWKEREKGERERRVEGEKEDSGEERRGERVSHSLSLSMPRSGKLKYHPSIILKLESLFFLKESS